MATTYEYQDAYLAKFCDEDLEARAIADVAVLVEGRTLPAEWQERVVRFQAYILVCLDRQADVNDLFTAKLQTYREEMDKALPQAIEAADDLTEDVSTPYNFPVQRA